MANGLTDARDSSHPGYISWVDKGTPNPGRTRMLSKISFVVGMLLTLSLTPHVVAQNLPKVTTVDPATGKVNDSVTLTGENLGKDSVSAVFLSDDKDDYKATLVEQENAKIVLKVPQVKSGGYNISIQEGDKILILPLHFTVQG
jgi:hypothetical protein